MNSQFKKGIIEMCVLELVKTHDMYGFEVIERLSEDIDVNDNTIYPILRRLTEQGYFENYIEPTSMGAPRKYFRITKKGTEKLEAYKTEWNEFLQGVSRIMEEKEK